MKFIFFAHSLFLTFAFFFVSGEANREHLPSPPPGKNNYHATNLLDVNNNSAQHTGCTFVELQTQLYDIVKAIESNEAHGTNVTYNDAVTWNYLRRFTNDYHNQLFVHGTYNVCFELRMNQHMALIYCTDKKMLEREVIGSNNNEPIMKWRCRTLLSDIIHLQRNIGNTGDAKYWSAPASKAPAASAAPGKSLYHYESMIDEHGNVIANTGCTLKMMETQLGQVVKIVERAILNGESVTRDNAHQWNYFLNFVQDHYTAILAGEFEATMPVTNTTVPATCVKVQLNEASKFGFCSYKYILEKRVNGTKFGDASMDWQCRSLLSDFIQRKRKALNASLLITESRTSSTSTRSSETPTPSATTPSPHATPSVTKTPAYSPNPSAPGIPAYSAHPSVTITPTSSPSPIASGSLPLSPWASRYGTLTIIVDLRHLPCDPPEDLSLCTQYCCDDERKLTPFCQEDMKCY